MGRRVRLLEASISLIEFFKAQLAFTMAEPVSILQEAVSRKAMWIFLLFFPAWICAGRGKFFPTHGKKAYRQSGLARLVTKTGRF